MKKNIFILIFLFLGINSYSQDCDSLVNICYGHLKKNNQRKETFISDGQVYKAFVDADQSAEFKVTLFGGTVYRIATTAGIKDNYVIFNLYDKERNLLFSNKDHNNKPFWDFKVDNTIDCYIEAYLDIDKKVSGCLVILLGFKR